MHTTKDLVPKTAIHNSLDGKDGIIIFLDLEKAFELAQREVIISNLISRGITGKLLVWTKKGKSQVPGPILLF